MAQAESSNASASSRASAGETVRKAVGPTLMVMPPALCRGSGGVARIELNAFNAASQNVGSVTALTDPSTAHAWQRPTCTLAAPAGTNRVEARIIFENTTEGCSFRRAKLEAGAVATAWSDEITSANTAQGLIDVRTRTTNLEAKAEVTSSAIAQLGGSGNLLENADFARVANSAAEGWTWAWNPGGWSGPYVAIAGSGWEPSGGVSIGGTRSASATASDYGVVYGNKVQVIPGKRYIVSGFTANHRCTTRLAMRFADVNGDNAGEPTTAWSTVDGNGGTNIANWEYRWLSAVAPANAVVAEGGVWVSGGGAGSGANPYFWFTRPMLEQASDSQTHPSPWSPSGSSKQSAAAFTAMSASVSAIDGKQRAQQVVATDVNGRWIGFRTENDGVRGGTEFLMDYFRLHAADGKSASMEMTDNYLRVFNANYQKIIGVGFGVGGALMEWFGPNIGAAACTPANCIECKTTAGVAIIRGSNAQGSMEINNTLVTIRDNNNVKRAEFGLLVD